MTSWSTRASSQPRWRRWRTCGRRGSSSPTSCGWCRPTRPSSTRSTASRASARCGTSIGAPSSARAACSASPSSWTAPTLRPTKGDSSAINQLLAHRLFAKLAAERDSLLAEAGKAEASLAAEVRAAGSSKPVTTIWQRAGVHRGETEQEMSARVRSGELDAVRGGMQALASFAPRQPLQYLEQYASALVIGTAGLLGALYGGGGAELTHTGPVADDGARIGARHGRHAHL